MTLTQKIEPIHGKYSLLMVFPIELKSKLHIRRGDYVKWNVRDGKLLIEKVE